MMIVPHHLDAIDKGMIEFKFGKAANLRGMRKRIEGRLAGCGGVRSSHSKKVPVNRPGIAGGSNS